MVDAGDLKDCVAVWRLLLSVEGPHPQKTLLFVACRDASHEGRRWGKTIVSKSSRKMNDYWSPEVSSCATPVLKRRFQTFGEMSAMGGKQMGWMAPAPADGI